MNPFKLLWSFDGRIGQGAYAGGLLLSVVMMCATMAIVLYLRNNWTPLEPFNLKDGSQLALIPAHLLYTWGYFALTAKRLHDLGVTGLLSLLLLVPVVGLIFIIVLLIVRGEDNDNRFGPGASPTRTLAPANHS
jgi:uncharacterized membrane protein YhaH (DUF805 family)